MDNYQDYVIKNGKFIGEFEKMYQKFDDPWHQSDNGYFDDLSRETVVFFIKKYKIKTCVEFGCGLGKTMNFIQSKTNIKMLGVDVSKTSIRKAKKSYPHLEFEENDIQNIVNYSQYECFFFSEITWYLLEDKILDKIFKKMKEKLEGKYFIHNLVFYKGKQKYGNNYFTTIQQFIDFCPFDIITSVEIDSKDEETTKSSIIFRV